MTTDMDNQGIDQRAQQRLWEIASRDRWATALAHPNIAFIKYWGNQDDDLRLPASSSLSMNLGTFFLGER